MNSDELYVDQVLLSRKESWTKKEIFVRSRTEWWGRGGLQQAKVIPRPLEGGEQILDERD